MKSAIVSVVGRPSVGKSTLVNTITGMKVSIVSPVPQTTRNKIRGIYTDSRGQLVFIDTPGLHLSDKEINRRMIEKAESSLRESDIVLYVMDSTRDGGDEEKETERLIDESSVPVVAVMNKTDLTETPRISERFPDALRVSALKDEGVDEVLIKLFSLANEGPMLYDESEYTDQNIEFRVSEVIREKTICNLREELPHSVYVRIEDMEIEGRKLKIRAVILTERDGQKGFIIGKGGENIDRIRRESIRDLRKIFPSFRIMLDLRIKSDKNWRNNKRVLDSIFGF